MARKSSRTLWAAQIKSGRLGKPNGQPTGLTMKKAFTGIILGVDPSLRGTGLAVVEFSGREDARLLDSATVRPPKDASLPACLGCIVHAVEKYLQQYQPAAVAVEETIYVQNFRTAQKLGAARGAAIGLAAYRGIPVHEFSPLRIKQAVAGYGRASKVQISRQVMALLKLDSELPLDESDAAATAICLAWTGQGMA